jgi:glycosyltransferase involved in cell wall biosynthesis
MAAMKLAIILPVFRNAESLPDVLRALEDISSEIAAASGQAMEAVFVIDGSPDDSERYLRPPCRTSRFPPGS